MFEAKPPRAAEGFAFHESWEGDALRELTWADLVARLSASRALRGAFGKTDEDDWEASFDASSAQWIAAHHYGETSVNLDASECSNQNHRIANAAANGIGTGFVTGVARK